MTWSRIFGQSANSPILYRLLHVVHVSWSLLPCGGNRQRRERRGTDGGRCRSVPGRKRASGHNCLSTAAGGGSPAGTQRSGGAALARLDAPPAAVALIPPRPPQGPWSACLSSSPRAGEDNEAWRRIDCSRISGLCVETPVSGPPWKSHTAGHTWCRRRAPGLLSAWCGVGRFETPCRSLTQQLQWSVAHAAKATSRVQTAHTIRASLLATASVALL